MDKPKEMETVLVIVLGLIVLYMVKRWNGLLVAALVIGMACVLVPALARSFHWAWMRLSLLLGEVSGRVLLTVVYVLVLLPLSLVARRKSTIRRKASAAGSYFTERNHRYSKEDLTNPW